MIPQNIVPNFRSIGGDMMKQLKFTFNMLNGFLEYFVNLIDRDGIGWGKRFMGDCCRKGGKGPAAFYGEADMDGNHFQVEAGSNMTQSIVESKIKICFFNYS